MKVYADANFVIRIFMDFENTSGARALIERFQSDLEAPFPVAPLLRYECLNAMNRLVCETRTEGQGRVTPESAAIGLSLFSEQLDRGELLRDAAVPWRDLDPHFEALVARHTQKHGFRIYDTMHVASALALGCDSFWSFDRKARTLAELEGLTVNPMAS